MMNRKETLRNHKTAHNLLCSFTHEMGGVFLQLGHYDILLLLTIRECFGTLGIFWIGLSFFFFLFSLSLLFCFSLL
jgi:hypothetical protein